MSREPFAVLEISGPGKTRMPRASKKRLKDSYLGLIRAVAQYKAEKQGARWTKALDAMWRRLKVKVSYTSTEPARSDEGEK